MIKALAAALPEWGLRVLRAVTGDPERQAEISAEIEDRRNRRDVIVAAMQFRMFWIAWSIAAIPLSVWFGWGVLDSLTNGALPDVAELPPQLKAYADTVWNNIFYAGVAGAGVQLVASAVSKRR